MASISCHSSITQMTQASLISSPRSKMKRQRGVNNGVNTMNHTTKLEDVAAKGTMGKKKPKREGDQKVGKIRAKEEDRMESRDTSGSGLVVGAAGECVMNWSSDHEYMPWLGGLVDEQMSWGSTWLPIWDMDFMGEAFTALYSDVIWDDDIWNLKQQIPIPLEK